MTSTQPYRFYAAEVSYFSGKVRPFFRYKNVAFEEIAPTPDVYRNIIQARTGMGFIPVVITPDDVALQDTSEIPVSRSTALPRGVGFHSTSLRGVRFQRFTNPYTSWMVQRPLDAYHALSPHARSQVDRALQGTGVEALLQFSRRYQVAKRNFKLVLAAA